MKTYHERFTAKQAKIWRQVRDAILAHPDAYDQTNDIEYDKPSCDTPVCILGWAQWFAFKGEAHTRDVCDAMGIDHKEFDVVYDAMTDDWPRRFQFRETSRLATKAKRAAAYIDHILTTGSVK